jgi:hypothetical protein
LQGKFYVERVHSTRAKYGTGADLRAGGVGPMMRHFVLNQRNVTWLALLALAVAAGHVYAAGPVADEYPVKAAFLLNFAKFVEWPSNAFKGPDDPIAICVLGQNPFGSALEDVVRNKTVVNRAFVVREISNGQEANKCHIVFVSAPERKRFRFLLEQLRGRSILTVGELDDLAGNGGIINFKLKDARVRIEIDTGAAERAGLHISSKLLSLAEIARK